MCDFSKEKLNGILSKADTELDWGDYDCIFHGEMPAGTYEEVRYYIPLACTYIEQQVDAHNFFEHFSIWIKDNYECLKEDGLIVPIVSAFRNLFKKATSSFLLKENHDHYFYPSGCNSVEEIIALFFQLSQTCDEFCLDDLFAELKESRSLVHAEWLVYISKEMAISSPKMIDSAISSFDYQKAINVINDNLDIILNDMSLYSFWGKRI